jgi:hypothetical protein
MVFRKLLSARRLLRSLFMLLLLLLCLQMLVLM